MKNLVVLSGAGVSAESGIKTFRDSDGLWENYPVEEVASIEGWYRNPALMLHFYNERRRQIALAEPNLAHKKIAALESCFNTTVVTQNIDNLHERAGSRSIIHLHGEVTKVRPENCRADEEGVIDIGYRDINIGDCDKNGVQLRPHIVWFGEEVPMMSAAIQAVEQADILLVIGSSLAVYPAAGLVHYTRKDCKIFLIDPKPIHIAGLNFTQIQEVASVGMEKFIEILRKNENF
ncbi:MAG: NAD-dependent protein deacylase [Bacteroidales bacterium]|nr:NAD-dependent protein deacylase [Bacteroidales bacterium]